MNTRDKYVNFEALNKKEQVRVDFRIRVRRRRSNVAIIAPHGGKIEAGTSEIAAAIAANGYSLYCFEGLKRRRNQDLHLTSTRFDEPQCLELVRAHDYVVAVHGCKGPKVITFLGGKDERLRNTICKWLKAAEFETGVHPKPRMQGVDPCNICNRGRRKRGVQLEISRGLRKRLTADRDLLTRVKTQ